MTWNTKKGKSEVLESDNIRGHAFKLAHKELYQVKEVTYLSAPLSEEGTTGENPKNKDRHLQAKSPGCLPARANSSEKPSFV